MPQFPLPVEHVNGHDDQPKLHAREPEVDDLDAVGEEEREPIAPGESAGGEGMSQSIAAV